MPHLLSSSVLAALQGHMALMKQFVLDVHEVSNPLMNESSVKVMTSWSGQD
jgi:hypothetical protein